MGRGTLFLFVGPSGAGKDSLMRGARARLEGAGERRFVFARRVVTRDSGDSTEDYEPATKAGFTERAKAGGFLLSWRAHGTEYGIPTGLGHDLAAGRHVVANVSRGVIADAVDRLAPVRVVEITAPFTVRVERLVARGRENHGAIGDRLSRAPTPLPKGARVISVVNDGTLDDGIARFIEALKQSVT